jgi:predicted transcriptional regulator
MELRVSMGTVQYHLDKLEKMGKVNSTRHGLYKYYFPVGIFEQNQKDLLQVLSQETAREILMLIIERKDPTQLVIANSIGISSAAVNWHIRRLIDQKIIKELKEGKYKQYQLNRNPKHILALLRSYYPNIWDKWSNRLIELFLSFSSSSEEM